MPHEYVEFEFKFEPPRGDVYPFSVGGAGGDARGELRIPAGDAPLPGSELTFAQALARLADAQALDWPLQPLGEYLFSLLFQGAVRQAYDLARGAIQSSDKNLRIKISTGAQETAVAALPWEYLRDPDSGPLVLLDAAIVRYLALPILQSTLKTTLPLKLLLTGAPTPPTPDVAREFAAAQEGLALLAERELITITAEPQLTPKILQRRLREGFQIWHFVGHGGLARDGKNRTLLLVDDDGDPYALGASELGIFLNRSGVRLIVLSACDSANLQEISPFQSVAPALVRAQTPAVVAMQFSVPQEATRAFAGDFYSALAQALPIDACVTEGRKAVMIETGLERPDWGTPVVYSRAPDGLLFELPATSTATSGDSPSNKDIAGIKADYIGATISGSTISDLNNSPIITTVNTGGLVGASVGAPDDVAELKQKVAALAQQVSSKSRMLQGVDIELAKMGGGFASVELTTRMEDLETELPVLYQQLIDAREDLLFELKQAHAAAEQAEQERQILSDTIRKKEIERRKPQRLSYSLGSSAGRPYAEKAEQLDRDIAALRKELKGLGE